MDIQHILEGNGLSEKEARAYLTLLELKEAAPSVIARKSGIKRPTAYIVLESLTKKGLIGHVKKNNLQYFHVFDPHLLLEDRASKYRQLKEALPAMLQLHGRFAAVPQMTVYEGKEGIIRIMEDTLRTSTELLCWADAALAHDTLLSEYYPRYIETKVRRKIWLRGIFCYDPRALKLKKDGAEELREVHLIPKEKFPFKNEINIYDNKIAIVSYPDQIGVIIENKNIADTQRAIFDFGFEYAKIIESQILTAKDKSYLGIT